MSELSTVSPRTFMDATLSVGQGPTGVIVAVIHQAFRDCHAPMLPRGERHRKDEVRLDAATWLLDVGSMYWRALGLDAKLFDMACELIPPALKAKALDKLAEGATHE